MISIVIVDDHPAVQIGLRAALLGEPGLVPVGSATAADELDLLLYRTRPDVLLLDYHLSGADGLTICQTIKARPLPPAVLLYSAYADDSLVIPAVVAGADGVVHKASPPRELYEAVRIVAGGGRVLPPLHHSLVRAASEQLHPEDPPILAMLIDHTPTQDIAQALNISCAALDRRRHRMLARLRTRVDGPTAQAFR